MASELDPPAVKKQILAHSDDDDDDEEFDETLAERLWGLTEMFPERVRSFVGSVTHLAATSVKVGYSYSRSIVWFVASSATLLVLPVMFEMERAQQQEEQMQQQRQILLGPNAAVAGSAGHGMIPGMMPGIIAQQQHHPS
ncbi:hypothetical protein ACJMK2_035281 [Sinanodonta woodiana]|uniref:Mitochondrial import receptor subunit TOM22 homolog n=1 Tax=Sinanodonta woodiana TaxID=1069815 RepID=A0ABD3WYF9_SINWO